MEGRISQIFHEFQQNRNERLLNRRCPVGKKIISDAQRNQLLGLDVSSRSMNTTGSSGDHTVSDVEISIFSPNRQQDRLRLITERRELTRRVGRTMGGDYNQFTMAAPVFDPNIDMSQSEEDTVVDDEEPTKIEKHSYEQRNNISSIHHQLSIIRETPVQSPEINVQNMQNTFDLKGNLIVKDDGPMEVNENSLKWSDCTSPIRTQLPTIKQSPVQESDKSINSIYSGLRANLVISTSQYQDMDSDRIFKEEEQNQVSGSTRSDSSNNEAGSSPNNTCSGFRPRQTLLYTPIKDNNTIIGEGGLVSSLSPGECQNEPFASFDNPELTPSFVDVNNDEDMQQVTPVRPIEAIRVAGCHRFGRRYVANPSPSSPRAKKIRSTIVSDAESSMVEEVHGGKVDLVLKPRKIVHPETPPEGLRRSQRARLQPLRSWLGEQPVYGNSPSGGVRLTGTSRVVVKDPRQVKTKTTDPVKMLERERRSRK